MPEPSGWSNPSVLAFADGEDPLQRASAAADQLLEAAVARGMVAPPVDPLALAKLLGLGTAPHDDIADASIAEDQRDTRAGDSDDAPLREFVRSDTPLLIAYNPNRPRGRLRFSIAHEIAHALFPGVADIVRHRTPVGALPDVSDSDEYELELLCNIVAGELLLPTEAVAGLLDIDTDIDFIMETRRRWDVSTEALLRRLVMSSRRGLALVAASRVTAREPGRLRVDYTVGPTDTQAARRRNDHRATTAARPAARLAKPLRRVHGNWPDRAWDSYARRIVTGLRRRSESRATLGSCFPGCSAWSKPLAGQANPHIQHVQADILDFGDDLGPTLVAHVVNDSARAWSRRGVAAALAARYPQAARAFRAWTIASPENLRLGRIHTVELRDGDRTVTVISMVAQHGFGPGEVTRLRYDALHETLTAVADLAQRHWCYSPCSADRRRSGRRPLGSHRERPCCGNCRQRHWRCRPYTALSVGVQGR